MIITICTYSITGVVTRWIHSITGVVTRWIHSITCSDEIDGPTRLLTRKQCTRCAL